MKYIKPTVKTYNDMPVAGGCGDYRNHCGAMSYAKGGPGCGDNPLLCQQQGCFS